MHVSHANWLFDWGFIELISQLSTSVCQFGRSALLMSMILGGSDIGEERLENTPLSVCQSEAEKKRQKRLICVALMSLD